MPTSGGGGAGPCFSPDGRWLAVSAGKRLFVHEAASGRLAAQLSLPAKYYLDIAFTADGRFLAGASNEETVKAYDTESWKLRHEFAWDIGPLKSLAFSRDGMLGAAGGARKVVVWDMDW
jgi:WD40 repeat protein